MSVEISETNTRPPASHFSKEPLGNGVFLYSMSKDLPSADNDLDFEVGFNVVFAGTLAILDVARTSFNEVSDSAIEAAGRMITALTHNFR